MSVSDGFRRLTDLISRLEATDREILTVETRSVDSTGEGDLVVDLSVCDSPFDDVDADGLDLTARSASVDEDGRLTVDLAVAITSIPPARPVTDDANGRAVSEESGSMSLGNGADANDGSDGNDGDDRERKGAEPVHRDPERLREVYDSRDTFDEMTEALGADVTAVTVRRNMIKHGIHEPRSNGSTTDSTDADPSPDDTIESAPGDPSDDATVPDADPPADGGGTSSDASGASDAETDDDSTTDDSATDGSTVEEASSGSTDEPVAISDGFGLPADLDLDRLKTIVGTSDTLYEAQTRFGLDRERTREVLSDLGVLDLVHGRVSTRDERAASPEEIDERIRERLSGSRST